jgi:hypothetical protein
MLARGRGTQFHPEVVDVFLQVVMNAVPVGNIPCRMLSTSDLMPGMEIARELLTQENIVLLGVDHVLTEKLIYILRLREQRDGVTYLLAIKMENKS